MMWVCRTLKWDCPWRFGMIDTVVRREAGMETWIGGIPSIQVVAEVLGEKKLYYGICMK